MCGNPCLIDQVGVFFSYFILRNDVSDFRQEADWWGGFLAIGSALVHFMYIFPILTIRNRAEHSVAAQCTTMCASGVCVSLR